MKKILNIVQRTYLYWIGAVSLLLIQGKAYAAPVIPTAPTDQPQQGQDILQTIITIIKDDLIPFLALALPLVALIYSSIGAFNAFKAFQRQEAEIGTFLMNIGIALLMLVLIAVFAYLMTQAAA